MHLTAAMLHSDGRAPDVLEPAWGVSSRSAAISVANAPDLLLEPLGWLIRLRWAATGAVLTIVAASAWLDIVSDEGPLLGIVAALATENLALIAYRTRWADRLGAARREDLVAAQILVDVAALTALLHWSGGGDNPFSMFYVFHVAIAGMLLPLRKALAVAVGASLLYAAMLVSELTGLASHHSLRIAGHHLAKHADGSLWRSGVFVIGYLAGFALTQLVVVHFVHLVMRRFREAEAERAQHEQVARSRERLARLGELSVGVAHTVRNPLHGVLSGVEILRRRTDPGDATSAAVLDLMDEGVQRIERVTSRLLALGRDAPLVLVPTDLVALAQDALRFVEVRARSRGVALALAADAPVVVRADPDHLMEAVANIVDNAVHASPAGATVVLRVAPGTSGARIQVEDRGPGIPEDVMPRIFDPFFTTRPVGEGTGLGLAITRRIVEEHGGEIHVESRPGAGTRVTLDVPATPERRGAG